MWDGAGTVEELLERSIGTTSLLSLLTCFFILDLQTYSGLSFVTFLRLCLLKEGQGQGMVGFLRRSPFAVCLKQGLRACQNLWHR